MCQFYNANKGKNKPNYNPTKFHPFEKDGEAVDNVKTAEQLFELLGVKKKPK
tara:strand:- start:10568 stop:10723 length:156 start_codon:yes stop_codon:yes gene_type:complete